MSKTNIILIIVALIATLVYFFMMGGVSSNINATSLSVNANNNEGAEVLSLLNQIKSIKIDATIFDSKVYKTLQDYSVVVPPQNVGRQNPFAPVR